MKLDAALPIGPAFIADTGLWLIAQRVLPAAYTQAQASPPAPAAAASLAALAALAALAPMIVDIAALIRRPAGHAA